MPTHEQVEAASRAFVRFEGMDPDQMVGDPVLGLIEAWKWRSSAIRSALEAAEKIDKNNV